MTTFSVPDMSCGHCTRTLERAVKAVDPAASVACDLAAHRVTVTGQQVSDDALREAMAAEGYPATVEAAPAPASAPARAGCCCGGGGGGCRSAA